MAGVLLPLPLKDFPRSGEDVALATERGTRWHGVSHDGEGEDAKG